MYNLNTNVIPTCLSEYCVCGNFINLDARGKLIT